MHLINTVYVCPVMYGIIVVSRAPEELFQQLDDNQVGLSSMKATRFVKAFEKDVDYWERTLSLILEVIEMILQVQRQWMYLEVCTCIIIILNYSRVLYVQLYTYTICMDIKSLKNMNTHAICSTDHCHPSI